MTQEFIRNIVNITFNVLYFLILIRVLMSWIPKLAHNEFGRFVYEVTEPVLLAVRKIIPKTGALDLTPLVVLLILQILQSFLNKYL